jgi:glycosyltransferase involved in cell wall biosynthesis
MIRVAALTSGAEVPSTRFRVRQFIDPLRRQGVEVREFCPRISKYEAEPFWMGPKGWSWHAIQHGTRLPGLLGSQRADVTWLERELQPGRATLERWTGRPRILDIDDAIWLHPSSEEGFSSRIAANCDGLVAGNRFLADHFAALSLPTWIVPTAVDTDSWRPSERPETDEFVIGWTGLASNLPNLDPIESALAAFLNAEPRAVLQIVAEQEPEFHRIDPARVRWIRWSPDSEAEAVSAMDVGLMPLPDTDWSRGKCAFKMIQYMAAGVPVITSPIGMNAEILDAAEVGIGARDPREWTAALSELSSNPERRRRLGAQGRRLALDVYSRDRVATTLAAIFKEIAAS